MSNLIGKSADDYEVQNEGGGEPLVAPGLHPAVITQITEGTLDNGAPFVDYFFTINGGIDNGKQIRNREWPESTSDIGRDMYNKKIKALLKICNVQGALQSIDQLLGIQLMVNNKPYQRKDDPSLMQNSINYYRSFDASAPLAKPVASVGAAPAPVAQAVVAPQPVAAPQPVPPPQAVVAPQAVAPAPVAAPVTIPPVQMAAPAPAPVAPAPVAAAPVQVAPAPQPVPPAVVQMPVAPQPAQQDFNDDPPF